MTLRNSILVTRTKSENDFEYLYRVEVKSSSNSRAESSRFRKNLNSFFEVLWALLQEPSLKYTSNEWTSEKMTP